MIRRCDKRNYRPVGVVLDIEPEDKNSWCSTCAAVGKLSRLRERIYLDDKGKLLVPQPPEASDFWKCFKCFFEYGISLFT